MGQAVSRGASGSSRNVPVLSFFSFISWMFLIHCLYLVSLYILIFSLFYNILHIYIYIIVYPFRFIFMCYILWLKDTSLIKKRTVLQKKTCVRNEKLYKKKERDCNEELYLFQTDQLEQK